jgi:Ca2+-binding EF-hand superfamily protein
MRPSTAVLLVFLFVLANPTLGARAEGEGGPPPPGDHVRAFMAAFDADGDGRVTAREFSGPREAFDLLDRSRDGAITVEDLSRPGGDRPGSPPPPREARPDEAPPADDAAQPPRRGPGAGMRARLRERLRAMDADGDGKVSREEYDGPMPFEDLDRNGDGMLDESDRPQRAGDGEGMPRGGRAAGRGAFRRFDEDGDGKVSRAEFPGRDERFSNIDADGDGFLSPDEMAAEGARVGAAAGSPSWRERDRDGNGKVSRNEFDGGDDEWRRLDRNADGWITPEENAGAGDARRPDAPRAPGAPREPREPAVPQDDAAGAPAPETRGSIGLLDAMSRMDANADGRVSRREFTGPDARFDELDRNQDGFLDAQDAPD